MRNVPKRILCTGAFLAASGFATAALAQQPLSIVVRPVATVVQAPFYIVGGILGGPAAVPAGPPGVFNGRVAERLAVGHAADGTPIIRARSLRRTGPHYVNPPNADWRDPIVLREGSRVPLRVSGVWVRNASVPGLVRGADYYAFVSPRRSRVVFMEPVTRRVAAVVR